jgi:putative tryptophan/tyrosine transport system substrate-binding protein
MDAHEGGPGDQIKTCGDARVMKSLRTILLGAILLVTGANAEAQQSAKIPLIGYLEGGPQSAHTARIEAFRQGLRERGYEEGKNIAIEWRFADGKLDRLPVLGAELAALKPAIIVTGGSAPTRAAKAATSAIPIVMANDNDPVASGIVAGWARPGGNITGLSNFAPELGGKRLEILREVVPKLSRVAVLGQLAGATGGITTKELELGATALGLKLQFLDVTEAKDVETAFNAAANGRAEGIITFGSIAVVAQRAQVIELATKKRLPGIYHNSQFAEAGGLMFYGVNVFDLDRRAATYVDRILKGAKPGDLPVEQPMKFDFVINLKAAQQIGLSIPPNVLVRATKVIK